METVVPLIRDFVVIVGGVAFLIVFLVALLGARKHLVPFITTLRELSDNMSKTVVLLEEQRKQLGETLISARALTDSINDTHRHTIVPTLRNLEEMSERLSRTARDLSYLVEEGSRFSHQTIQQATYYRDRVFRPVIEAASLWSGLRAVARALPNRKLGVFRRNKKKGSSDGK